MKLALRVTAALITALSVAFMFWPDVFRAPVLALGLGGQFVLGTVVLGALAYEVFSWASRH